MFLNVEEDGGVNVAHLAPAGSDASADLLVPSAAHSLSLSFFQTLYSVSVSMFWPSLWIN